MDKYLLSEATENKVFLNKIDEYIGKRTMYVLIVESNNLDFSFENRVNTLELNKWNTLELNKWNLCVSKNKKKLQEMANDLNRHFYMPNKSRYFHLAGLVEFAEYVTSKYNLHLPKNYIDFPTFQSSYKQSYKDKTKLMEYQKKIEKLKPFMTLDPYPCKPESSSFDLGEYNQSQNPPLFAGISYTGNKPETKFYVLELHVV